MSAAASSSASTPIVTLHKHARSANPAYPARFPVPDNKVPWNVTFSDYKPPSFTAEKILKREEKMRQENKEVTPPPISPPLNPYGRTGLKGRGKLYTFGPNFAADPIVTRESDKYQGELEVVVIQRHDSGAWAFPGGMVDKGEEPQQTAKREFGEESLNVSKEKKQEAKVLLDEIFTSERGVLIYAGYIDDPRNTDNAWLESTAFHFHIDSALAARLSALLKAGDDAKDCKWILANDSEPDFKKLYASHRPILERTVEMWKKSQKEKDAKK